MIFDALGKLVTKRYKIIIPIWIILILILSPFIPSASKYVSLQQGSSASTNSESQIANNIISMQFGSSSSQTLTVVISSKNVTSNEVQRFVFDLTKNIKDDKNLSGLISFNDVYLSSGKLLNSTINAELNIRNATVQLLSLFFGIPYEFLTVWKMYYNQSNSYINKAENKTVSLISSQITNATQLYISKSYLSLFVSSFSSSNESNLNKRINFAISNASLSIIKIFPSNIKQLAYDVSRSFNIENFTSKESISGFTILETSRNTLFTYDMCLNAYRVINKTLPYQEAVNQMIRNPVSFGVPDIYMQTVSGFLSKNNSVMLVTFSFSEVSDKTLSEFRNVVKNTVSSDEFGSAVYVTGGQALTHDIIKSDLHDADIILPVTIILLLIATGIYFRSVFTPAVSLGSIGIALGISQVMIILVALYVAGVDATTPTILLTVLMGVGTDYSIFMLARYREERIRRKEVRESVATSVRWAGESVTTSGLTVIISFLFLGLQPVAYFKSLGLVVGLGVLIALFASLTLIPSIIMVFPRNIFYPNVGKRFESFSRKFLESIERRKSYFSKSSRFAIKHAKLIILLSILITLPAVYVWSNVIPSYDFISASPKNTEAVSGFNILTNSFGSGSLFPTYVVIKFSDPVYSNGSFNITELKLIDKVSNITLQSKEVVSVSGPTRPANSRVNFENLGNDTRSGIIKQNILSSIGKDSHYAILKIGLASSPYSTDALNFVSSLRQNLSLLAKQYKDISGIYVGGATASVLDTSVVVNSEFYRIISYVAIVVALILFIVLRSAILPLLAVSTVVMSITWTIALTDIFFTHVYNSQLLYLTPLVLFVLLLGLGMDYNIFILTRIREERIKGSDLNNSIITSIENTGGIITAAAIILAGSLGALFLSSGILLKEFGFAFFVSIIIDAMITRTYIVPACMSLLGKWNWYAPPFMRRKENKNER